MGAAAAAVNEPQRERAVRMLERVTLECRALHVAGVAQVRAAAATALALRDRVIEDDHDPRYLHPARTQLILLADAACRDADVLAAAAFVESLPADPRADASGLSARATTLLAQVPLPDDGDELLERLISVAEDAALIAIAERLDHARHLHMMPHVDAAPFLDTIEAAYLPAAGRLAPAMAGRLRRWADASARRWQRRRGASARERPGGRG